jgi:hypothetical protein
MLPSVFEFTESHVENIFGAERDVLILFRDSNAAKADYWYTYK